MNAKDIKCHKMSSWCTILSSNGGIQGWSEIKVSGQEFCSQRFSQLVTSCQRAVRGELVSYGKRKKYRPSQHPVILKYDKEVRVRNIYTYLYIICILLYIIIIYIYIWKKWNRVVGYSKQFQIGGYFISKPPMAIEMHLMRFGCAAGSQCERSIVPLPAIGGCSHAWLDGLKPLLVFFLVQRPNISESSTGLWTCLNFRFREWKSWRVLCHPKEANHQSRTSALGESVILLGIWQITLHSSYLW